MIGNLTDLARRPDMPSEPTLRKLIKLHQDFPILWRGDRGKSYRIDLDAAAAFVRSLYESRILDPVRRRQAIQELGLEMLASEEPSDREAHG